MLIAVAQEIHPDNLEHGDAEDLLDAVAASQDLAEEDLDFQESAPEDRFIMELFIFTRPVAFYRQLFEMPINLPSEGIVVLTSTAHPASWMAARRGTRATLNQPPMAVCVVFALSVPDMAFCVLKATLCRVGRLKGIIFGSPAGI